MIILSIKLNNGNVSGSESCSEDRTLADNFILSYAGFVFKNVSFVSLFAFVVVCFYLFSSIYLIIVQTQGTGGASAVSSVSFGHLSVV